MSEPNNGKAPTTSADKYTGAIILRTRPHTYKRVVRLLSEGVPAIRIARDCKVTERSVAAIAKREREEITERKKSLAGLMSNIAEIGGANVERKIGKASVRDAIIGTGVAIDKLLALTGQTPAVQIANIVLPSEEERAERRALHDKLDEIAADSHTDRPWWAFSALAISVRSIGVGPEILELEKHSLESWSAAIDATRRGLLTPRVTT